jgi:hypothetical protein
LFVDFDSAEPYKGVHGASHKIEINKFGKSVTQEMHKFSINNTSSANKIEFKIFRSGTRKADRLRQLGIGMEPKNDATYEYESEFGLLASTEISLSHLSQFTVNQPMAFMVPIKKAEESDMDFQRENYKVEQVYALFTLNITDKTFGELIINLNELRGLPFCKMIREI